MIGKKLVYLREKSNLTKAAVAERLGVTYQTYTKYEKNETNPDYEKIALIADLYNISADYLLDRKQYENTNLSTEINKSIWEDTKDLFKKNNYKIRNAYESYRYDVDIESLVATDFEAIPDDWFKKGHEYIVIKISKLDMSPDFVVGDNVIVKLQETYKSGDFVLVQKGDNFAIIRQAFNKQNNLILVASNTSNRNTWVEVIDNESEIRIIGIVVELRRRLGKVN